MRLEYGISVGSLAHGLRRFERLHRMAKWLRRSLWRGVQEAFLELLRWAFAQSKTFGPPLYAFSVYQALRTGHPKHNGRIITYDQGVPVVQPDSLLATSGYNQHAEQPWPIFWTEHSPARLAAESLALMEGKQVCLESVYGWKRLRDDPAYRFIRLPPPVKLWGNWTSIVSRWVPTSGNPNYTHWLLDALPRLGLLDEFPPDTQILVPRSLFPSQKESLALLGLLDRCRFTSETHLQVERFFFSAPTAMLECYNPYGINFLRRVVLPKRDLSYRGPRKFLIQRTGSARNLENAVEVQDFLASRGWGAIQPANLTFAQQIKLFAEAEAICGTIGSGFTNAVFCQPGCKLVLLAQDFMLDSWLEWISQVVKADYRALICRTGYRRRIAVELPRLKQILQDLDTITC